MKQKKHLNIYTLQIDLNFSKLCVFVETSQNYTGVVPSKKVIFEKITPLVCDRQHFYGEQDSQGQVNLDVVYHEGSHKNHLIHIFHQKIPPPLIFYLLNLLTFFECLMVYMEHQNNFQNLLNHLNRISVGLMYG